FQDHTLRHQGWTLLLYAVCQTRLVLQNYLPIVARVAPCQHRHYSELVNKIGEFSRYIAPLYGPKFSTAGHIKCFGRNKNTFLNNLPKQINPGALPGEHWKEAEQCRQEILELAM